MTKVIFDTSATGSGKTTTVNRIGEFMGVGENGEDKNRIILITQSVRSCDIGDEYFVKLEGRRGDAMDA